MELQNQKRLSADILKCSQKRIVFDVARLEEIKESITKADIRQLISDNAISRKPASNTSKYRARKRQEQKRKGRRRGVGSRKGTANARLSKKKSWMARIRLQRKLLKDLRDKKLIDAKTFTELYRKSSGGFFRTKRHIKHYINEKSLVKK